MEINKATCLYWSSIFKYHFVLDNEHKIANLRCSCIFGITNKQLTDYRVTWTDCFGKGDKLVFKNWLPGS